MNRPMYVRGTMVEDGQVRELVIADGVVADLSAALQQLAEAVTRSRPSRGGHLWSHVWALADAARLGRQLGDPRHVAWQEEALATAQRCGMRALASQLLPGADPA